MFIAVFIDWCYFLTPTLLSLIKTKVARAESLVYSSYCYSQNWTTWMFSGCCKHSTSGFPQTLSVIHFLEWKQYVENVPLIYSFPLCSQLTKDGLCPLLSNSTKCFFMSNSWSFIPTDAASGDISCGSFLYADIQWYFPRPVNCLWCVNKHYSRVSLLDLKPHMHILQPHQSNQYWLS